MRCKKLNLFCPKERIITQVIINAPQTQLAKLFFPVIKFIASCFIFRMIFPPEKILKEICKNISVILGNVNT